MQKEILELITKQATVQDIKTLWQSTKKSINITGLTETVKAGFLCAIKETLNHKGNMTILVTNRDDIRIWRRELLYFYSDLEVRELYPVNFLQDRVETKNQEVMAERIAALELMLKGTPGVVFVTAEAFIQKLPETEGLLEKNLSLSLGEVEDREEILAKLVAMGYERTEQVETLGQFAVRGDILDVFPINLSNPIRIEWFDTNIDAMRSFSLADQRAIKTLDAVEIVPITVHDTIYNAKLFDYLGKNSLPVLDEPGRFFEECKKAYSDNKEAGEDYLFTQDDALKMCHGHKLLITSVLTHNYFPKASQVTVPVRAATPYNKNTDLLVKDLQGYLAEGICPIIEMSSKEKAASLAENLTRSGAHMTFITKGSLLLQGGGSVFVGEIRSGFRFWHEPWLLLTESDIFGVQKRKRLPKHQGKGNQINYFSEIKTGDYVVHDIHGIGRYEGVETIEVDGLHRDYLRIQYAGTDKLFMPIDQIRQLHKYVGSEGRPPRLSKMGGADWSKVKTRAQKAITIMATDLLRLYAQRKISEGHAFSPDTPWQKEFEDSFPFEETPDQLQAIKEIKHDMEQPIPMERLLCGDVGYGKTEVAIRAAFKAVMDNKQVAVLAPTTVLAQQHLLTFSQRMGTFGVKVDMLSRFRSTVEQKGVLEKLADRQIDVLIGTHRILQPDVQFPDLGLLIIDEEQRFGVAQKEKIKKWTTGVDVLTLSATPIPRTLHLALVKGKDMSVIESPPEDRLPVETYVAEYDDGMVKEAIEREIRRGGRVYYVYNRVEGLEAIAQKLHELVPGLSLRIAHGKMNEFQLEEAMVGFYNGDFDLLLCTTIIENGLDVPLANTIIIQGAENFGLSQLYQMRGRVGRSSRLAYAYFLYKKQKALSEIAQKRLQAIRDFTELGAGFQIAMRDLEIRGAGNILGAQQHGHIAGIGFAAYCQLLEDTINRLQNGDTPKEVQLEPIMEIKLDAYIPNNYIENPRYKLEIYRRLGEMFYGESNDLLDEIIDRFGNPPKEVENLWKLAKLKGLCRQMGVQGITIGQGEIRVTFGKHSLANPDAIMQLVRKNVPRIWLKTGPATQLIIKRMVIGKSDPIIWLEKQLTAML